MKAINTLVSLLLIASDSHAESRVQLHRSTNLLVKYYFFSSDGAPDFGADSIEMILGVM